ncbi:hypothetical protein NHQ30_011303 [Ciborinia camelliae]|nr:hypothetical protein NHQ30_011303 [Ciborinia camelliae]
MPPPRFQVERDPDFRLMLPFDKNYQIVRGESHSLPWEKLEIVENGINNIKVNDIVLVPTIDHGINYALVWQIRVPESAFPRERYALIVWYFPIGSLHPRNPEFLQFWTHCIHDQATIIPMCLINSRLPDELRHEFCNNPDLAENKWRIRPSDRLEFAYLFSFDNKLIHFEDRKTTNLFNHDIPLINAMEIVPDHVGLTFPRFEKLPTEVRMMIWDLSVDARTCVVYPRWYGSGPPYVRIQLHIPPLPKTLFVCHETLDYFQKNYTPLKCARFTDRSHGATFINFRRDTIVLHDAVNMSKSDITTIGILDCFVHAFQRILPHCRIHNLVLTQYYYQQSSLWEDLRCNEFFRDLKSLGFVKNYPVEQNKEQRYPSHLEIIPCVLEKVAVMHVRCETGKCQYQSRGIGLDLPHLYCCFDSKKKDSKFEACKELYEANLFGGHPDMERISSVFLMKYPNRSCFYNW